ncbi:MAG: amidophosphoribosyltransferase [Kiritimatiellae bacterium]|nr:amidophosphoribosyltransferase [Kiritimatiellia bacterium]
MSDELKHECAVAMVVLRKAAVATGDYGGTKLSLLLEKQHNRGQDGAGAAILSENPTPGEPPYWIAKSASAAPLADVLGAIGRRSVSRERIFLGHLRYATFGKNEVAFCHPFVHESSELAHTLLLAGNFNLTNAHELFDDYSRHGSFPTSKADGYLITELVAHELAGGKSLADSISTALAGADGAWTLCGATGDGWAFATRDPHGIRPGFYYIDDNAVVVASERPAIQAAFDVPPEAVKELPPGEALVVSPDGTVEFCDLVVRLETRAEGRNSPSRLSSNVSRPMIRPCSFERIYFSRANDADIHRERKALGAALVPQILKAADAPMEDIFFSYIPNSARIAFHGLIEHLFDEHGKVRFGEIAVKDAKFRTFIADAAARREFYKHVYDVTYGLVRPGRDTLVVLDDSIVRGNTMKNAILPMLDRLGPKRIVIASSAPPIRYPDCYGIDMSTLGELVAFRALVNLLNGEQGTGNGERTLREALEESLHVSARSTRPNNPLAALYARFTDDQHCAEIARLLTPPDMKAEVKVVYQSVESLRRCLASDANPGSAIGDWYFTGDYPTPGGHKVLENALRNHLERKNGRSY